MSYRDICQVMSRPEVGDGSAGNSKRPAERGEKSGENPALAVADGPLRPHVLLHDLHAAHPLPRLHAICY